MTDGIETLDKSGTIAAIERLKREFFEQVKPYHERLAAFLVSEKPALIVTPNGVYEYTGPLPPPPEVKNPPLVDGSEELDWTEDFAMENGNYQNTCRQCERTFLGHKRRIYCKFCTDPSRHA